MSQLKTLKEKTIPISLTPYFLLLNLIPNFLLLYVCVSLETRTCRIDFTRANETNLPEIGGAQNGFVRARQQPKVSLVVVVVELILLGTMPKRRRRMRKRTLLYGRVERAALSFCYTLTHQCSSEHTIGIKRHPLALICRRHRCFLCCPGNEKRETRCREDKCNLKGSTRRCATFFCQSATSRNKPVLPTLLHFMPPLHTLCIVIPDTHNMY